MLLCQQRQRKAKKKRAQELKVLADAETLKQARRIVRQHQHNRSVCEKKLLVAHYRVLLCDLGAGDKVRQVVDGKTVLTKRPGLLRAYWELHTDLPPSPDDAGGTLAPTLTLVVPPLALTLDPTHPNTRPHPHPHPQPPADTPSAPAPSVPVPAVVSPRQKKKAAGTVTNTLAPTLTPTLAPTLAPSTLPGSGKKGNKKVHSENESESSEGEGSEGEGGDGDSDSDSDSDSSDDIPLDLLLKANKERETEYEPKIGDTVEVYWKVEKKWFEGEVLDVEEDMFQVSYVSDGQHHWHECSKTRARLKL